MIDLKIVKYCAEEVERQQATPIEVWWMIEAWLFAMEEYGRDRVALTPNLVEHLGKLVDRRENKRGWRRGPVYVGTHIPPHHDSIPGSIDDLFSADRLADLTPGEVYKRFEEIHPFADGNGRTGKIIFNWLNGTLHDPQMPPNFWGIANP